MDGYVYRGDDGDTAVATETGPRPIENTAVGEKVWSFDPNTGQSVLAKVYEHPGHQLREIEVAGQVLHTTDSHPFWVTGRGWTEAGEIVAGDVLRTREGHLSKVVRSQRVDMPTFNAGYAATARAANAAFGKAPGGSVADPFARGRGLVYNIEVDGTQSFYVGESGILVHNK
jgi:hypothetical protein